MQKTFEFKKYEMISFILMGLAIILMFQLKFVTLIFSMILTYIFIEKLENIFQKLIHFFIKDKETNKNYKAIKIFSILIIGILIVLIFSSFFLWVIHLINSNSLQELLSKLEYILIQQKDNKYVPDIILNYLPNNIEDFKNEVINFVKNYVNEIKNIGKNTVTFIAYILLGFIIGALIRLDMKIKNSEEEKRVILQYPNLNFKKELQSRIKTFKQTFELVFIAQIKISLINTLLTASYIYILLPLFDYSLPFKNTVIILTFLFGLIPVLGNLISNTIIIILSIGISFNLAIASLIFLVVIHKLEYFLEAKIIGSHIKASIWEILIVLIVFESLFGFAGVIIGNVIYGYIKEELSNKKMI